MPKYPIQSPILRGKKRLEKGSLNISAEEAAPLIKCGALGEAIAEDQQIAPLDEARKIAIITAMQAMMMADPESTDESMWTKSGRPELDNLRKRLKEAGADVVITGQDRDQIWAEIKPA